MSNIPGSPDRNQGGGPSPGGHLPHGHVESYSQRKQRLVKPLPPPQKGDLASEEHHALMREGPQPPVDDINYPSRREVWGEDVEPENIRWLWEGYVPQGMATLLEGNPGEGKSLLACEFSRSITRGKDWPDGSPCPTSNSVLWMSSEDTIENTIVPRLMAAGADLGRMRWWTGTRMDTRDGPKYIHPTFPRDIDQLRYMILQHGAMLFVLDPLSAYMDKGMSTNDEHDVREVLGAIHDVCEETGCGAVCLRHLNKRSGGNSLYRGGGSIGIIASARSALLVGRDPTTQARVLALAKGNHADVDATPSWVYKIEECEVDFKGTPIRTIRIVWQGQSSLRAAQLLQEPELPSKTESVVNELEAALLAGEDIKNMHQWANEHGFSWGTVSKALKDGGIKKGDDGLYYLSD